MRKVIELRTLRVSVVWATGTGTGTGTDDVRLAGTGEARIVLFILFQKLDDFS